MYKRYVQYFALALPTQLIIGSIIYLLLPEYRYLLIEEDKLVENLTVLFYLISGILGFAFTICKPMSDLRPLLSVVAIVAILCLLDELSFGQRFVEYPVPQIAGVKIYKVHDLIEMAQAVRSQTPRAAKAAALLSFISGFAAFSLRYWRNFLHLASLVTQNSSYLALAVFAVLGLIALVLDQDIIVSPYAVFVEELCEMNAALTLILLCISATKPARRRYYKAELPSHNAMAAAD